MEQPVPCQFGELGSSLTRLGFRRLNEVVTPAVQLGLASPPPIGGGLVLLETIGRRSGRPRQVPLVASRIGSTVVVSTVRSSSQWVRNLVANPRVKVWVNGRERSATGRVLTDEPLTIVALDLDSSDESQG